MTAHILSAIRTFFFGIAAFEHPDFVEVLGGWPAHIHRVFGVIDIAIRRYGESGRRFDVGACSTNSTLKPGGTFGIGGSC